MSTYKNKHVRRMEACSTGFMKAEVCDGGYWEIETNDGTWFVPMAVELYEENLSDYYAADIVKITPHDHGWCARLSAPGYLDCTDWMADTSLAKLADDFVLAYGE